MSNSKAYRINPGYLSNVDEWNFHEITRAMGINSSWNEVQIDLESSTITAFD
jgi:hypothetical protein